MRRRLGAFFLVTLGLLPGLALPSGRAHAAPLTPLPAQPAGTPFPTQDFTPGALPAGTDSAALAQAMDDAFLRRIPALGETRAVVILHGGRLVTERYAEGYLPTTRMISWSVAKSITQALVGVAVREGRIDPDRPMGNPHWAPTDRRAQLSWRTWLQMVDGQSYVEIGERNLRKSNAAQKLFGDGRFDVASYCAELPLIHQPGTHWNYNSCGIVLIADALTRLIVPSPASPEARREAMARWVRESLFLPLGMQSATPEFDATGLYYGSASIYATARDFARFGLLYLRDGVWEGKRILPPGWVDFARTPGPGQNANCYGAGWWVMPAEGEVRPAGRIIDTGPVRDVFCAQGHEGQFVCVIPSKDLVLVRLGLSPGLTGTWSALFDWLGRVARSFPVLPAPSPPPPTAPSTTSTPESSPAP